MYILRSGFCISYSHRSNEHATERRDVDRQTKFAAAGRARDQTCKHPEEDYRAAAPQLSWIAAEGFRGHKMYLQTW